MTGAGGLTKAGAGTLVLNGASSYGGGTTIAGGTLAGNSTSLQGAINGAAGTTLRFDQDGDGAFNGALSGAGQLVKNGAGALTLTQPSSYTGGTQVNAGTLIGDTTSLQGNIANNANLVFAQNVDGSFNGVLSGNGTVVKNGAGTLTASGVQPFSGTVVVDAGALALGTAASPAVLPALVQVNAGGTLAGSGTIAGLSNAGTVNAGTANGPLRVAGNFQNLPSGTVQVDLTSPGASQVGVQGAATLAGTLRVADGFQYNGTNSYTVLTAAQGVQGQFANTELPQLAFIDASVRYDPNDVLVDFTRNATDFPDLAQTGNESAVAQALQEGAASNANGAGSPLYNAVLGLSSADVPKAFRQLSGDSHAALVSALLNTADTARTTPMHRFNDSLDSDARAAGAVGQGGACVDGPQSGEGGSFFSCRRNVWADVIGNWQHQDGDGNAPSYRQETGGIMVGGDVEVRDGWRVGAAFGYQDSDIKVDSRDARADTDNYSVTLFGGKAFPTRNGQALKVMAGTSFTWSDISTRRDVTLGSASQQLKADYSATTGQVFGEIGYSVPVTPSVTVEPFAGVAYAHQRIHGFSEDGGSAALNADSDSNDITTTTVGVRGGWSTDIAGRAAHLRAALGWRHAMGDVDPERTMAFDTGPSFTVAGTPIARDALVTELGAEVAVSKSATVGLSYRGQHGGGSQDNAGFLNVRWAF
ncbi:hypothetical protein CAL12_23615 [Bordetella genomosp. 8]|uniref:Autotransporter domain-containing protein n=1 Tax=Bordetella genomosp. 8 TaxID=1416806 RepID=A0A1W6YUE1_9BORD|nr:hypothetical protein CAL12_23615 [Bordetella genomosp. 8]